MEKAGEINSLLHVVASNLFIRNLQNSIRNHHLRYVLKNKLQDWYWQMRMKEEKTQQMCTHPNAHIDECIHPNNMETKSHTHKERGRLYPPPIPSFLLSMQSFPRTEETEKNLFYPHVIASELVGGMRESKKRGRRKSERCRKGADSSPFENSLNSAAPK